MEGNSETFPCFWQKLDFDYVDHNKLKNSERDGNTRLPYLSPEKVKKQQLEPDMEQQTGPKLGKE